MSPRSFGRDRDGSVAVMTALGLTVLFAAAAFGIDIGAIALAKRKAQGAVDIAATLAAANLADADAMARRSLSDNGYTGAVITVRRGSYAGDSRIPLDARFVSGASPASAVKVTLETATPTYFAPALGLNREAAIVVEGTAASAQFAAFTIGSGLASLDSGIANAILSAMLGQPVTLSVMDYEALLTTRVDGFRVLDALAPGLDVQVANYNDVAKATATLGKVIYALKIAADGTSNAAGASSALGQVASALRGGGPMIRIDRVVDLGDAAALAPGQGAQGPTIALMEALSNAVALANGQRQVAVDLGPSIPGLLSTKITLGIGERRQSSGYVQPGSPNATVKTAQARLLIEAGLTLPLGLGSLTLPIYVQAANATATLRSTTCPGTDRSRRQAVLDVRPGGVDIAIASIPKSVIDPTAATPDLTLPASLLRVPPALIVSGRSRLTIGGSTAQTVTFGDDDIARHTVKTVSSQGLTQSAVTSLIRTMDLNVNGLGILAPGLVTGTVATALTSVAPALDSVLDNTLRTIGLRVGTADVSIDGSRCDQAVLVQ